VKSRNSCLDGVPTGQPALALAQKVLGRVTVAGLPADLIPSALTTVVVTPDGDVENTLRTDVLEFIDAVRQAERTIAATRRGDEVPEELDIAVLDSVTAQEWHAAWPLPVATEPAEELDESAEATGETAEPEVTGEAEPQAQPAVIEEEFPATEMPVITEAEVASNGVTDEFEEMAPAEGQPDSVEPQS
jgi:XTP/dITP diphosphohydrolase